MPALIIRDGVPATISRVGFRGIRPWFLVREQRRSRLGRLIWSLTIIRINFSTSFQPLPGLIFILLLIRWGLMSYLRNHPKDSWRPAENLPACCKLVNGWQGSGARSPGTTLTCIDFPRGIPCHVSGYCYNFFKFVRFYLQYPWKRGGRLVLTLNPVPCYIQVMVREIRRWLMFLSLRDLMR